MNRFCRSCPGSSAGFSLVEVSVVLVIIGLLVAAIMGGQALLYQARLRSVMSDVETYRGAVKLFIAKYDSLPGDMSDATSYWGASGNGDEDSQVDADSEDYRAWQQLALAGMIPGTYSGSAGSPAPKAVIGTNMPSSRIDGGGFNVAYVALPHAASGSCNQIVFASVNRNAASGYLEGPVISAQDAWSIDIKADDGIAATGYVRTKNGLDNAAETTGCMNTTPDPDIYDYSSTDQKCRMYFCLEELKN